MDSFSPAAGRRVEPDGTVSYDFDGHITARGVDLQAGTSNTPPNDRKVRWVNENGVVVAEIYAFDQNGVEQLHLDADYLTLRANNQTLLEGASSSLLVDDAKVRASAVGASLHQRTVIDENAESCFVQLHTSGEPADFPGRLSLEWSGTSLDVRVDGALVAEIVP